MLILVMRVSKLLNCVILCADVPVGAESCPLLLIYGFWVKLKGHKALFLFSSWICFHGLRLSPEGACASIDP